jgi:archaellum component FlaC
MPKNIDKQMEDIKLLISDLEEGYESFSEEYSIVDLRLKYVMAETLIDIRHQLFEISHYGIGTD